MSCNKSLEELARFSAGDSPPGEANDIALHVEDCPHCQEKLSALEMVDESLTRW